MSQGLKQEMQLLPRMLQSLEVLQLAVGELDAFLVDATLENEALCVDEPRPDDGGAPPGDGAARTARHDAWLESQPDTGPGLAEHLEAQLALVDLDRDVLEWVRLVIGSIDARGYLSVPDDVLIEMAAEQGLRDGAGALGRAIGIVQGLEPRGIGGRDVVESLLLQLDPGDPDYPLLCRLLEEFLDAVARNKLPAVARGLGIELDRLGELLTRLRELDPAPGAGLTDSASPTIQPDIVVERVHSDDGPSGDDGEDEARFEVRAVDSGLASVALDPEVRRLATDPEQSATTRSYLREKVDKARWLLEALEQRKRTLLAVAQWIFSRQRAFLEHGPGRIVPATMTAAADELGVHLSTVSRAVAGKYAETPHGLIALRTLFQAPAGGSETTARGSVQEALRVIVAAEDPARPLSDDDLALALRERGYDVARRTVAKYRGELGIASSYRRRRYAG